MEFTLFNKKLKFDRNEFAGSFGDIGTDLPLIIGMILACGLDSSSTLIMFGIMQILTGIIYGFPMPVQPFKIMAVIMITSKLGGNLLYGAGFATGIIMMFLTLTGFLDKITKIIPKSVIRGIQFGLGISLAGLALKDYIHTDGIPGYVLALLCFLIILFLLGNKKYPAALFVILIGFIYALFFKIDILKIKNSLGFTLPVFHTIAFQDIIKGFFLLALPQIPLSITNSIVATKQTLDDFYPENTITTKKIGFTYSLMNLINPFFTGIPTCHGAGGLAGHHQFGARTGGSVIIYGLIYLILGLFFGSGFGEIIKVFPFPVLGIILVFEGISLMLLIKDISQSKTDLLISLLIALIAVNLKNGYVIGLIIGTGITYFINFKKIKL